MKMDKVVLSQWEKLCINDALHDHYDKICRLAKAQLKEVKKAKTLANIIYFAELKAKLFVLDRLIPVFMIEPSKGYEAEIVRRDGVLNELYAYASEMGEEEVKK